jgi:DNA polymerase-1
MELRVWGFLSKDPIIYEAYVRGRDIHIEVASAAFGVPYEEVTYEQRYAAKYIDFGVIYGRSADSLVNSLELGSYNWTQKQAQGFIDEFLGQFKVAKAWIDRQHRQVRTEQFVETPNGRRRRWPLLLDTMIGHAQRQAVNSPIQGFASDFTVTSIIALEREFFDDTRVKVVATVHDQIDLYVDEDHIEEIAARVYNIMTTSHPIEGFDMPLKVDVEIGNNWGDLFSQKQWLEIEEA